MARWRWYSLGLGALLLGAMLFLPVAVASADVITPHGACTATGTWATAGVTYGSTQFVPSSVVTVPQKDKVNWQGHEHGEPIGYFGPSRPIDGAVQVSLPYGIPAITVWHWGGDKSPRYSNEGQESYNVPSALIGIKMQLSGYEKDSGVLVCSGSVYVEVVGSKTKNPIGWAAIAGIIITLALMLLAGFQKTRAAYDDLNP
ncbi:MAG TPA: hypothetical protein VED63_03005 [Acidimicrobiales bacterium]|nr:hypothetical protein [Acidimicrobiales bacterium]